MKEKRDLYDLNGNKTKLTYLKGDKVTTGYYPMVVMIVIQNSEGKFLMQKRVEEKGGDYGVTGGHPKSGETPYEGIITEVQEELGIVGAAMAPAVFDTLAAHLADTGRAATDFDLIATGDLGWIGRDLLLELCRAANLDMPADRLVDCGGSLYYQAQDAHAGGSGCGCVASVSCGWLMKRMERGELGRVLLIGSGAMLSATSAQQGQSVPGIAYGACLERSET